MLQHPDSLRPRSPSRPNRPSERSRRRCSVIVYAVRGRTRLLSTPSTERGHLPAITLLAIILLLEHAPTGIGRRGWLLFRRGPSSLGLSFDRILLAPLMRVDGNSGEAVEVIAKSEPDQIEQKSGNGAAHGVSLSTKRAMFELYSQPKASLRDNVYNILVVADLIHDQVIACNHQAQQERDADWHEPEYPSGLPVLADDCM